MAIIHAYSDLFVKYLLGSNQNIDLLRSFINAVLEDSGFGKVSEVRIKNPFNVKTFQFDKESILDIKAKDEHGRLFDVEVQTYGKKTYSLKSLYYWARFYSSQLKQSDNFWKLRPVISINLLTFKLFEKIEKYHTCFLLQEKDFPGTVLSDHQVMHFLELPKIVAKVDDDIINNKLNRWMLFFKGEGEKEDLMEVIIKNDPDIYKAHDVYEQFTADEELQEMYEARQKWLYDVATMKVTGYNEGMEKGIEKDKQQVLIKQLTRKFGLSDPEKQFIESKTDLESLDSALESILFANNKEEVLDCLTD